MTPPFTEHTPPTQHAAPAADRGPALDRRLDLRLAAVALAWLALARWLERAGTYVIPDAWKRHVELQTFLIGCQGTTAAAGLGLAFALLARRPAVALLGLTPPPRARDVAAAALVAPAIFVVATAVALRVALPVLLAEASTRGPQISRENAGAFGRALTVSPLLPTLVWGVAMAALTEELLFRGALYALIERLARRLWAPGGAARGPGIVAAAGAALVFALLHWDLAGGVGIVRVVSALCLGVACGAARYATGSVAAAMALHLVHNTIAVGQARRWFADEGPPPFEAVPLPETLFDLAALGLAAFVALVAASAIAGRRTPPSSARGA